MIQCFVKNDYKPVFVAEHKPRLVSVSKIDSNYTIHPRMLHCHKDLLEILFVCRGRGVYVIDGEQQPMKAGDIIICNAGILHDEVSEESEDLYTYCIAVTNVKIEGLPDNCLCGPNINPCNPCREYKELMEHLYKSIYSLAVSGKSGAGEVCEYLAGAVLRMSYQIAYERNAVTAGKEKSSDILGRQLRQYIDTHYDTDLTLKDIADVFSLSPHHISHVFKKAIGYPPIRYMLRRRLGEAQNLLIYTDYSITMIASMVGYDNPSHFNNMFVKNVKMSPGEYRKNYTDRGKK